MLWVILLGTFGVLFAKVDCKKGSSVDSKCRRMKVGVYEDVIGMLLWLFTFVGELLFSPSVVVGAGLWLIGGIFPFSLRRRGYVVEG